VTTDERPTWIDEALSQKGRSRRVALYVRYFMAAPLIIARSDLLLTALLMLVRYFAELVPLKVLKPPIRLPSYPEEMYWHERYASDPAHSWLRQLILRVTAKLGTGLAPERTRWTQADSQKTRAKPARRRR
jgi:hypothetical protein